MGVDDFVSFDTSEIFRNAPVCKELVELEKELAKVDYSDLDYQRNRDWSILNSQVVGAEYMN